MRLTDGSIRARLTLGIDLLALILFVVVGMRSHGIGAYAQVFFRNAVPVCAAWLCFSLVVRTYQPPRLRSLLITWILAVPVALVVRTAWVGSPRGEQVWVFLGVATAFTMLFLLAGRAVAELVGRRLADRRDAEAQ
jgi:hypothetical protein